MLCIVAPCLAVMLTDSQCFLNVFFAPDNLESVFAYQECLSFSLSFAKEVTCTSYGAGAPVVTVFQPPFLYSFQCSTALLTNYVPVFLVQYALSGTVLPLMRLSVFFYLRKLLIDNDTKTLQITKEQLYDVPYWRQKIYDATPTVLWPVQYAMKYRPEKFERTANKYVQAPMILFSIVGGFTILLTFGFAYPPLAFAVALTVASQTAVWHIIIQHHVNDVYSVPDNDTNIELFRWKIEHDSRKIWKQFIRSTGLLLLCCSVFYGLYFLDAHPFSISLAVAAVAVPLGWVVFKQLFRKVDSKLYFMWSRKLQSVSDMFSDGKSTSEYGSERRRSSADGISLADMETHRTENPMMKPRFTGATMTASSAASASVRGTSVDFNEDDRDSRNSKLNSDVFL